MIDRFFKAVIVVVAIAFRHSLPRAAAVGICLLENSIGGGTHLVYADEKTFEDVVRSHFSEWSHNEKVLTSDRVNHLVNNPAIKGAEAAAIAAIHNYQRKMKKDAHPATLEMLTAPRKEDPSLRRDQPAAGANLHANFKGFLAHLSTAPRQLFATEKPALEGIKQGHLGDCYFICTVGVAVHLSPERFRSLYHPHPDGSCDVEFPSGHKVHVPALTDSQIVLGSSAGEQGMWLNVLEVAAGKIEEARSRSPKELELDKLGEGGDSVFSIQLLTGHKAEKELIRAHLNGQRPAPHPAEISKLSARFGETLREAALHHRIACCGIGDWKTPPGMASHHQYGILGYKAGAVHVFNPWGGDYHFDPKGTPGLENGYVTQHGQFVMPIEDFVHVFGGVNVETTQPAPHKN